MNIAVLGQGYVGLTAAVCLANTGHRVIGVESDPARLASLRERKAPFFEPQLDETLSKACASGRLSFDTSLATLPTPPDAVLVAVGSPQLPSGGTDLSQVMTAMQAITAMETLPRLVMVKSTVPPGTSERLLAEADGVALRGRYVYSPEFLSQGAAVDGWCRPSRIVAGLADEQILPLVRDLYRGIEGPWLVTTLTDAEMIKYASNAFLATKISFVNEIANLCDGVGADIDTVVQGIGLDPRIGTAFLRAGIGYGGSCFPKDTRALTHLSNMKGHSMPLIEAAITTNNAQRLRLVRILRERLEGHPNAQIAVLGLTFKPGTDDLREAPSLTIVPELSALGFRVRVWDPVARQSETERLLPGIPRAASIEEATTGASAVVIVTEWQQVVKADWSAIATTMEHPRLLVDGRNCLSPAEMASHGLTYAGMGRARP